MNELMKIVTGHHYRPVEILGAYLSDGKLCLVMYGIGVIDTHVELTEKQLELACDRINKAVADEEAGLDNESKSSVDLGIKH